MTTMTYEDGETITRNIKYLTAGARTSERVRLIKYLEDHRGDRRRVCETYRASEHGGLESAIEAAVARRDEIDARKNDITWLREEFPEEKDPSRDRSGITFDDWADGDVDFSTSSSPDSFREMTFEQWMEAGLEEIDDRWVPDPNADLTGYLYRIKARNSESDFSQKRGIYSTIKCWGRIQDRGLDDLSLEDVRSFVTWMESQTRNDGSHRYAKATIKKYYKTVRGMISQWAKRAGVRNPVEGQIDIKPERFQGRQRKRKARSPSEIESLREGLITRVEECSREAWLPYRALTRRFFEVHRYTGLRVNELLHIEASDLNTLSQTLTVRNLKIEKQKQTSTPRTREIPAVEPVRNAIETWSQERTEYGFPSISEEPIIFCCPDGGYASDERICHHYQKACKTADIDKINPKFIRHSVISRLAKVGCPMEARKKLVGHQIPGIQGNYIDIDAEQARPYLERLWETDDD